jgi:hypothetical protein
LTIPPATPFLLFQLCDHAEIFERCRVAFYIAVGGEFAQDRRMILPLHRSQILGTGATF